jgi:hypothetical protein
MDILSQHKKRHSEERPFACDVLGCSYSGKVKTDLWNHKHFVHAGKSSECRLCGRVVKVRGLKAHMGWHEQNKKQRAALYGNDTSGKAAAMEVQSEEYLESAVATKKDEAEESL